MRVSLVALFVLCTAHVGAQTSRELNGELSGTIAAAAEPYILDQVVVPAGATLTLEPGVELVARAGSSVRVEGRLISRAEDRPIVVSGMWDGALISSGRDGRVELNGLSVADVRGESLVRHESRHPLRLSHVGIDRFDLDHAVRGEGSGRVVFEHVQITSGRFADWAVYTPEAAVLLSWTLLAQTDLGAGISRSPDVRLHHATLADLTVASGDPLFAGHFVGVYDSVVWPGATYRGFEPSETDGPFVLARSVIQGGWSIFLGTGSVKNDADHVIDRIVDKQPEFVGGEDRPYALQAGSSGESLASPLGAAIDRDGSAPDAGAYGGETRRSRTAVTLGFNTALQPLAESARRAAPDRGLGFHASIEQDVSRWMRLRANGVHYGLTQGLELQGGLLAFYHDLSITAAEVDVLARVGGRWAEVFGGPRMGYYHIDVEYPDLIEFGQTNGDVDYRPEQPSPKVDVVGVVGLRVFAPGALSVTLETALPLDGDFITRVPYERTLVTSDEMTEQTRIFKLNWPMARVGVTYSL